MTIRGTLSVYELLIQQIRATNGAVFVTSAAKVESSSGLSSGDNVGTITFEDPSGNNICPFVSGDFIMAQRIVPGALVAANAAGGATDVIKKLVYRVASVSGRQVTTETAYYTNTTAPAAGDDFVRIGNAINSARRGGIYLTSDDSNAPFMDIFDGVDSYAAWHSTDKTKTRVGNLAGLSFGGSSLSGYGLFGEQVYLTGSMQATDGEWAINDDGSATFANNRIKMHADGTISVVGPATSGTTSLVFREGTDSTPDAENHTDGDYWSLFQTSTGDFGIMENTSNRLLCKSEENIELPSGDKFYLGMGDDADTGFARDDGNCVVYVADTTGEGVSSMQPAVHADTNNLGDGQDLGSSSKRWRNLWCRSVSTSDIHMTRGEADCTLREMPDCLLARNNVTGKTFKMDLTETSDYPDENWDQGT